MTLFAVACAYMRFRCCTWGSREFILLASTLPQHHYGY